jgi:peptidoglycan/LPS O-acetylase OafA/YrhL
VTPAFSTLLDLIRVLATAGVFLHHAEKFGFISLGLTEQIGHNCVIIFFVLSGYVIAYSTLSKKRHVQDYIVARLSRLSSVVIPALILSALIEAILFFFFPETSPAVSRGYAPIRYLLSFFYLQESASFSACPPINGPLWSVAYEFWYYALFGVAHFAPPGWRRNLLLIITAILAGPKILLLLPAWLLGAGLFRLTQSGLPKIPFASAGALITGSLLVYYCIHPLPNPFAARWQIGHAPLFYSADFIPDLVLGFIFSLFLLFFHVAFSEAQLNTTLVRVTKLAANMTFSCYLYHYSLLAVLSLSLRTTPNTAFAISLLLAILFAIILLSRATEARRENFARVIRRAFRFEPGPQIASSRDSRSVPAEKHVLS